LRTGEQLHFKAKVVKRKGRDNASFNPVSLSNFSYIQDPKEADKKHNILDKERRCPSLDRNVGDWEFEFPICSFHI
jgi:hypothetical protein